jgi:hypothetical protein
VTVTQLQAEGLAIGSIVVDGTMFKVYLSRGELESPR